MADTPPAQTLAPRQIPSGRQPTERHPRANTLRRDGHWSGRYASYWNAFLLFQFCFVFQVKPSHAIADLSCQKSLCNSTHLEVVGGSPEHEVARNTVVGWSPLIPFISHCLISDLVCHYLRFKDTTSMSHHKRDLQMIQMCRCYFTHRPTFTKRNQQNTYNKKAFQ